MHNLANHIKMYPHSAIMEKEGRLYGQWIIGNNYRATQPYHGSYPPSYVERVKSLFPDNKKILHLYSGMVQPAEGEQTFDINPALNPTKCGKAEELSDYFSENAFSLVLADPPYTPADAAKYGAKMPITYRVMSELYKIVEVGGVVVWLCTRIPLWKKIEWKLLGVIGLFCGTNRVYRAVVLLQKINA